MRLLHDVEAVGETRDDRSRAKDNLLIRGDALNALPSLCELPEFAREHVGEVKLAYLDPPFNAKQAFEHYGDALEHSVWLTMMRDRLLQIRKLLAPDGSVRLQHGDLRIVWESDGCAYEPDFVAIEKDATHWLVEPKADKDLQTEAVLGKELAAKRWANYVSSQTGVEWAYLLVGETDVVQARGSWAALKKLGR